MIKKSILLLLAFVFLAACQVTPATQGGIFPTTQEAATSEPSPTLQVMLTTEPGPTVSPPTPSAPPLLATPYSDSPAAGICDFYPGELVVFEIFPDIPSPRCARATPKQRLKVINRTEQEIRVWIGSYEFTLQPGQEHVIDAELRTYLAPGVHQVSTTAYSGQGGPELWLTTDP